MKFPAFVSSAGALATQCRINHSEAYSLTGVRTIKPKAVFHGFAGWVADQHYHVSPRTVMATRLTPLGWRDHRRTDNGGLAKRVVRLAMAHPISREWKGYWRR